MHLVNLSTALFLFTTSFCAFSQTSEYVNNPSFEDVEKSGASPKGWYDCGFDDESPVDVHSSQSDFWGVKEYPADGNSFVGMVFRDNDTYEGISAKLIYPLLRDSTYRLTISVKQSPSYISSSRINQDQTVNFDSPAQLEIWGGNRFCQMDLQLEVSAPITVGDWQELTFYITLPKDINYLSLFVDRTDPYDENGHILIDNLTLTKVNELTLEENPR